MENKVVIPLSVFTREFLNNSFSSNMFKSDGTFNPNYNYFKKTGTTATIFEDHWDNVYSNNKELIDKYRPNALKKLKKLLIVIIKI